MLDYSSLRDHGNEFAERMLGVLQTLVLRRHADSGSEEAELDAARVFLRHEAEAYHRVQEETLLHSGRDDAALLQREHHLAREDVAALRDRVARSARDLLEVRGELARYVGRLRWLLGAAA